MPGRSFVGANGYRYGFNGKENDNEVKGNGNQQDYGMRIYDPRLGRFLTVDPLTKDYAELTPYQFASNKPIWRIDRDGLEEAAPVVFTPYKNIQTAGDVAYNINSFLYNGAIAGPANIIGTLVNLVSEGDGDKTNFSGTTLTTQFGTNLKDQSNRAAIKGKPENQTNADLFMVGKAAQRPVVNSSFGDVIEKFAEGVRKAVATGEAIANPPQVNTSQKETTTTKPNKKGEASWIVLPTDSARAYEFTGKIEDKGKNPADAEGGGEITNTDPYGKRK